jgi:hypothetical protein
MNIAKIYKHSSILSNRVETYYIETTDAEYGNFIIMLYNVQTNTTYIGTFSSGSISNPDMEVKDVHKMLTNTLESKADYHIFFSLENFYFRIEFQTEIMRIRQDIPIDIKNDESLKSRYSMLVLQTENDNLKARQESMGSEMDRMRIEMESMSLRIQNLERLSSEHSNSPNVNVSGVHARTAKTTKNSRNTGTGGTGGTAGTAGTTGTAGTAGTSDSSTELDPDLRYIGIPAGIGLFSVGNRIIVNNMN